MKSLHDVHSLEKSRDRWMFPASRPSKRVRMRCGWCIIIVLLEDDKGLIIDCVIKRGFKSTFPQTKLQQVIYATCHDIMVRVADMACPYAVIRGDSG